MAIEQALYDKLNPLSDAQLQEKIQQAESYVARGTREEISRLCSQPLTPEYPTNSDQFRPRQLYRIVYLPR